MDYNFTRRYGRSLAVLLVLAIFAMAVPVVMAQSTTTGDVTGTVTDPSGAVVPGADVTLKSMTEGTTLTTTTNQTGAYRFPLVKPGQYKVTVSQKGFKSVAQT